MTTITKKPFFMTEDGQADLYTLHGDGGVEVDVSSFGGAIVSVRVPDKHGEIADVVLGYEGYEGYRSRKYFLGAALGRCCNRIARGTFSIDGKDFHLACNDGRNHLHGGNAGFDVKLWDASIVDGADGQALALRYHSPDGEEGYPGTLRACMTYSLDEKNALKLHYHAVSDKDTLCGLSNHSYFNLSGHASGSALHQELRIGASCFTEADEESIPTGRVLPVEGTPMDFRGFHVIGERIESDDRQLQYGHGYDHNWVLDHPKGELGFCAALYDPKSGRYLECYTDMPCMQFYTGNFLDGTQAGKEGCRYVRRAGVCLETQFAPDAIHHPEWETPLLKAGQEYNHTTVYRFFAEREDGC